MEIISSDIGSSRFLIGENMRKRFCKTPRGWEIWRLKAIGRQNKIYKYLEIPPKTIKNQGISKNSMSSISSPTTKTESIIGLRGGVNCMTKRRVQKITDRGILEVPSTDLPCIGRFGEEINRKKGWRGGFGESLAVCGDINRERMRKSGGEAEKRNRM